MSATKQREAVQYALSLIKNSQTGKKVVNASVVERGTKTVDQIARELAKSTTLTQTDVVGVIQGFIEFTLEHVAAGYRVELGNMGKFYPTIEVKSCKKLEDFTPSKIQALRCRFLPSNTLLNLLAEATFEKTLGVKNRKKSIADVEAAMAAEIDAQGDDEGDGNGNQQP